MELNADWTELLSALNGHDVKYLLVGAYAVGIYAEPRATKDLDLLIESSPENAKAVFKALAAFGAPLAGLTSADFSDRRSVFQIGQPPLRVDILQSLDSVDFAEAWKTRRAVELAGGLTVPVISSEHLIRNKLALGRLQDLADVERLRQAQTEWEEPD